MIERKDLREGNLVNVPREDQSPFRIDLFEHESENYFKIGMNVHQYELPGFGLINGHPLTWENHEISGIPLTEELLKKCNIVLNNIKIEGYLHEFQNFYFYNTGKELDVSLILKENEYNNKNT